MGQVYQDVAPTHFAQTRVRKTRRLRPIAIEDQQRFAIREGGKTVGAGVVTKITA